MPDVTVEEPFLVAEHRVGGPKRPPSRRDRVPQQRRRLPESPFAHSQIPHHYVVDTLLLDSHTILV